MINNNIILLVDSYKTSHFLQYPDGTETVYSYLESRGGKFSTTTFFGLQYIIKRYLQGMVVTKEKISQAKKFIDVHMGPGVFNESGWNYILEKHGGKLPIKIMAVPEGTTVPVHNVLMTIENTDPNCYWLTNYIETLLMQVWYPITVCTLSRNIRNNILSFLRETGDPELYLSAYRILVAGEFLQWKPPVLAVLPI